MVVNVLPIAVVGCGPGACQYLTQSARDAVARADALVGSRRLLDLFPAHPGLKTVWHSDAVSLLDEVDRLRHAGKRVAVLVSGDPGLCSLALQVVTRFGLTAVEVLPGVSSIQVAFARLGLDWSTAKIISAHGRTPNVAHAQLAQWDKVALLAGSAAAIQWSAAAAEAIGATHAVFLCENLTLEDECVRAVDAAQLAHVHAASLSIVLFIRKELVA